MVKKKRLKTIRLKGKKLVIPACPVLLSFPHAPYYCHSGPSVQTSLFDLAVNKKINSRVQKTRLNLGESREPLHRLPGESREPGRNKYWIPAFAGMTKKGKYWIPDRTIRG
jgi:hypothetical protein